jgi:hypothetical protein
MMHKYHEEVGKESHVQLKLKWEINDSIEPGPMMFMNCSRA